MTKSISKTTDYAEFFNNIKSRLKASRAINYELIDLYWLIGKEIVEKQKELGWGKSVVEKLSKDLQKDFPRSEGYSADNLWRMRQFYNEYFNPQILEQLVPELTGKKTKKIGLPILERLVPEWRSKIKSRDNKKGLHWGKMNESEKAHDDKPSIGIILCAERDKLEVEFSLRTKINPIGVAEYKLFQNLPADLKGKLPTSKQLTEGLK